MQKDPEKVYAIRPNKTELKREHAIIHKLAVSLLKKTPQALKQLPLNENILRQIEIAQNIKGGALKRQLKHITNQLISLGEDSLEILQNGDAQQVAIISKKTLLIEQISQQLIAQEDDFLEQTLEKYSQLERQKLRTLILSIRREKQKNLPAKTTKTLTKYLHQQIH